MIRASIDLGTNTCLLLIVDWDESAQVIRKVLHDEARVVRLGQGVDSSRMLHPDAMERVRQCLLDYAQTVLKMGAEISKTVAVATSQARDSQNGSKFFNDIESKIGFSFRVISGADEAHFAFTGGLIEGWDPNKTAVIDIGGGSTEYTGPNGGISLDMGSVRFTERFLKSDPVSDSEFWSCESAIDHELQKLSDWRATRSAEVRLLGVAGTTTTLAAYHLRLPKFDAEKIHSTVLSTGDVHRMVEELKWRTVHERSLLPGVESGRADVLLAGALILWRSMEILQFPTVTVSVRGLRYGILNAT